MPMLLPVTVERMSEAKRKAGASPVWVMARGSGDHGARLTARRGAPGAVCRLLERDRRRRNSVAAGIARETII
jgi:hypothetical protein